MTREEMEERLMEYCERNKDCNGCICKQDENGNWHTGCTEEHLKNNYELVYGEAIPTNRIKDSGERTEFVTGALRDMHEGKGRLDLLPCTAILELAKHCEAGAKKYGERNVDKGIPQHSFIDSGLRHLFKYLRGDRDENHLVAALWNIAWAVEQDVTKPELNDIPSRKESEG